jgi:hypothetical protein
MIFDREKEIADAILYEGYILYPYRASAVKNQHRWTFGGVFPQGVEDEISTMRTEILLRADAAARVEILVRFLQTQERQVRKLRTHALGGRSTSASRSWMSRVKDTSLGMKRSNARSRLRTFFYPRSCHGQDT